MKKDMGGGRGLMRELSGFFHLGFADIHYGHQTSLKAVQFCRIDRKGGGWHANHGGLYDAIFYPMAKAVTARLAEVRSGQGADSWKYLWLMFPIVVTTSDLLAIDATANTPVALEQSWVRFSRDLKGGKINGNFSLDFVRYDQLESFVHKCITPLCDLAKDLVENKTQFLLNANPPWEDEVSEQEISQA